MSTDTNESDTGQAIHDLFLEVFALHAALSGIMDTIHEQAGLNTSQHKIMRTLTHLGSATVPDMAARLGVSRQFVQTVCNKLSALGYIEFIDNPRHKRSRLAMLTEPGRAVFQQSRQKENAIIQRALPETDPEKVAEARALLEHLRKSVQEFANADLGKDRPGD